MSNDKEKIRNLHNKLLSAVALDYLDKSINGGHDHRRFLLNCRKHLTTPREQSITNVTDVLDLFERKGIMSPGDYQILKDMVKDVNQQIVHLIEETEQSINRIKEGPESDKEKANDESSETKASYPARTHPDETKGATRKTVHFDLKFQNSLFLDL